MSATEFRVEIPLDLFSDRSGDLQVEIWETQPLRSRYIRQSELTYRIDYSNSCQARGLEVDGNHGH